MLISFNLTKPKITICNGKRTFFTKKKYKFGGKKNKINIINFFNTTTDAPIPVLVFRLESAPKLEPVRTGIGIGQSRNWCMPKYNFYALSQ